MLLLAIISVLYLPLVNAFILLLLLLSAICVFFKNHEKSYQIYIYIYILGVITILDCLSLSILTLLFLCHEHQIMSHDLVLSWFIFLFSYTTVMYLQYEEVVKTTFEFCLLHGTWCGNFSYLMHALNCVFLILLR